MSKVLRAELVESLSSRQGAFLIGAGASIMTSGNHACSSWLGLIRDGVERVVDLQPEEQAGWGKSAFEAINAVNAADLIITAQEVVDRLRKVPGRQYAKWLADSAGRLPVINAELLEVLAGSSAAVLTTNYDTLIEEVTGRTSVTWNQLAEMQAELRDPGNTVIHLHGEWSRPDTVVFGYENYAQILGNQATQSLMRALVTLKSMILIGVGQGLYDPNFTSLTTWLTSELRDSGVAPVALVRKDERSELERKYRPLGINVLSYGSGYEDLPVYLADLIRDAAPMPNPANPVEFTWDGVSARLRRLQRRITREFKPDLVIAASGPGNFAPAHCLSQWGEEPPLLCAVSFPRRPDRSESNQNFAEIADRNGWLHVSSSKWDVYLPGIIRDFRKGSRVLVFDDRVIGGNIQRALVEILADLGFETRTAALVVDPRCQDMVHYFEEVIAGDFTFPWGGRYGRS